MADYRSDAISLTTARQKEAIVDIGAQVASVHVLAFTVGSDVRLHFGKGPEITLNTAQGLTFEFDDCDPENEGVFLSNTAQPGVTVTLLISFASGPVGVA